MNQELLDEIKFFARLQFSEAEIKLMTGAKIDTVDEMSAMQDGWLLGEAEVRQSLLKSASNGSNPAQTEFMKLILKRKSQNA